WAMWATAAVLDAAPAADRADLLERFAPLRERPTAFLLSQVSGRRALPPASPDYWEHRARVVPLGTAAPVLAGLEASARLHDLAGDGTAAAPVRAAADRSREAVVDHFGRYGYGRYPGPPPADAASAFLLPPYQPAPLPGAVEAWQASMPSMIDRKSTRLNSSHVKISYAVFCLKKKKRRHDQNQSEKRDSEKAAAERMTRKQERNLDEGHGVKHTLQDIVTDYYWNHAKAQGTKQ